MVEFGLDYACAHIIILAEISSENLLPIRADFVTERVIRAREQAWFREARGRYVLVTPRLCLGQK